MQFEQGSAATDRTGGNSPSVAPLSPPPAENRGRKRLLGLAEPPRSPWQRPSRSCAHVRCVCQPVSYALRRRSRLSLIPSLLRLERAQAQKEAGSGDTGGGWGGDIGAVDRRAVDRRRLGRQHMRGYGEDQVLWGTFLFSSFFWLFCLNNSANNVRAGRKT
jgi:hypothetical protein